MLGPSLRMFMAVVFCSWVVTAGITAQTHPDDTCWQPLGSGVRSEPNPTYSTVNALSVFQGDLIAAGYFTHAGEVFARRVARWNDTSWFNLGNGIVDLEDETHGMVNGLAVYNGDLFAGGAFKNYDPNILVGMIARWNGSSWQNGCGVEYYYSTGCLPNTVYPLQSHDGLLYAGMVHASSGSVTEWDGYGWRPLYFDETYVLNTAVNALLEYDGKLVVGGYSFRDPWDYNHYYSGIGFWNGESFEAIGDTTWYWGQVYALTNFEGKLAVAGYCDMNYPSHVYHRCVAVWDGSSWTALGGDFNNNVNALTVHEGRLIAGGDFGAVGGVYARYIAQWDGERWQPLGSGMNQSVRALISRNGKLIAGGRFTSAGEQPANYIAQWQRAKILTIRDARNDSLANVQFDLIRVTNNRPIYTEDTLGSFVTDDLGRLVMNLLSDTVYSVTLNEGEVVLNIGDSIKIAKHVYSEPAVRHNGTKYSIHLDNGDFADDGRLFFDTVALGDQEIVLNHTEIRYNLLVSLEWDAAELYVDGLRKDFRQMSNYLYDVTDGQVRLDTITILDNGVYWDLADVRILASNVHNPNAGVRAIDNAFWYPIVMPRKWFGNEDQSRLNTYLVHPLMDAISDNFRTLAHELGHFALGFYDEYKCTNPFGDTIACCMVPPWGNLGFMQYQYDRDDFSGPRASEMSSEYMYATDACQTTDQWTYGHRSCWDYFEHRQEKVFDDLYCPIRKPHLTDREERVQLVASTYFAGPNDDLYDLDYDVGQLVRFTSPIMPPAANVRSVRIKVNSPPIGGAAVYMNQTATGLYIAQGNTTDEGRIWALGVDVTQDVLEASGYAFFELLRSQSAVGLVPSNRVWLCGNIPATDDDSLILDLQPVQGSFPLICEGRVTATGWEFNLTAERSFVSEPQLDISTSAGMALYGSMVATTDGYTILLSNALLTAGSARVRAMDDAAREFFFVTAFEAIPIDSPGQLQHLIGSDGTFVVSLDSINSGIQTVLILSSPYPVLMNGLANDAIQVGKAHSLTITEGADLAGVNSVRLYYSESDLAPISGYHVNETELLVHHWNGATKQWEPIGGLVDTTLNFVATSITETGVFTLFAVQIATDVDDDNSHGSLPYRFELSQNYPNPFNPVTTIEYSLPERSLVIIEVFNVLGRKVRTLVDREEAAGSYKITWNATDEGGLPVSTGVYMYRFRAGEFVLAKKMLLLK